MENISFVNMNKLEYYASIKPLLYSLAQCPAHSAI